MQRIQFFEMLPIRRSCLTHSQGNGLLLRFLCFFLFERPFWVIKTGKLFFTGSSAKTVFASVPPLGIAHAMHRAHHCRIQSEVIFENPDRISIADKKSLQEFQQPDKLTGCWPPNRVQSVYRDNRPVQRKIYPSTSRHWIDFNTLSGLMKMTSNPYVTPESSSKPAIASEPLIVSRDVGTTLAWLVLFPCVGGFIGFVGYLVTAMILESSVMPNVDPPKYTRGQQSGLISLPLSTVIGFAAGIAFAMFVNGGRLLSSLAMFIVAILGAFVTYRLWYNDAIGECNSAIVLYYPIFGLCALIAICGIVFATITIIFRRRSNRIAG